MIVVKQKFGDFFWLAQRRGTAFQRCWSLPMPCRLESRLESRRNSRLENLRYVENLPYELCGQAWFGFARSPAQPLDLSPFAEQSKAI